MKFAHSVFLGAAMVMFSLPALAQRPAVPVELEGQIQSIQRNTLQDGVVLKVNGTTVEIPAAVIAGGKVTSPTSKLTNIDDIVSVKEFHGRPGLAGLKGGLAIITGRSDATGVWADNVFLEPAENTVVGAVTANDLTPSANANDPTKGFRVEGVEVVLLPSSPTSDSYPPAKAPYDSRLPGLPATNNAGLAIKPGSIKPYADASAEGYFGIDPLTGRDVFYAFSIRSVGDLVGSAPAVTITRAQCRVRSTTEIELDIRGAVKPWTAGATVSINPPNAAYNNGRPYNAAAPVTQDNSDPGVGQFRLDGRLNSVGGCPTSIIVKFAGANDAVAAVENK